MTNRLALTALLIILITVPTVFGTLQVTSAQADTPILGYPYNAHQASGTSDDTFVYGSHFQLNEAATVTSMSCRMYICYDITSRDEDTTYRFAIYSDSDGSIGNLIGQTMLGSVSKPVDVEIPLQLDDWQTLSFDSPISLQAGTYWLVVVAHGPNVMVYNEINVESTQMAMSTLDSPSFPSTMGSINYINDTVCAIYASGQGASSVLPAPSPDATNPGLSTISINTQNSDSANGKVNVFGVLSVYGASVPQANIEFAYRGSGDTEWHPFGSTSTSDDGNYSLDWSPPASGNYLINATYWGNTIYSPVFKAINVLVTSGNQSQTVFSVDSNSIVADLAFDSANAQLSFSVTGETGTTGYVDVCVAKNLVADPSTIQAFIDGNTADYTVTSAENSWILHFTYHHSSHDIEFDLNSNTPGSPTATPEPVPEMPPQVLLIVAAALVAVAVVEVSLVVMRKKR